MDNVYINESMQVVKLAKLSGYTVCACSTPILNSYDALQLRDSLQLARLVIPGKIFSYEEFR